MDAAPTFTSPKATLEGVAVRVESAEVVAVPMPLHPMASEESDAVLLIVNAPDAFPAEAGLNVAVRLALAPAGRAKGSGRAESEIPEPDTEIAETVMREELEFFN